MKKLLVICSGLILSSCYTRVGELTIGSTRNIDSKENYVLIKKYCKGKGYSKNGTSMDEAINRCIKNCPDSLGSGEYLKNVSVYIRSNGKRCKVIGDVWGTKNK